MVEPTVFQYVEQPERKSDTADWGEEDAADKHAQKTHNDLPPGHASVACLFGTQEVIGDRADQHQQSVDHKQSNRETELQR